MLKLITKKNCKGCEQVKNILEKVLENKYKEDIEYISLEDFGRENVIKLGVMTLPILLAEDGEFTTSIQGSEIKKFLERKVGK